MEARQEWEMPACVPFVFFLGAGAGVGAEAGAGAVGRAGPRAMESVSGGSQGCFPQNVTSQWMFYMS